MNKLRLLKITNTALFISAAAQAFTGIALFFHLFISRPDIFEAISEIHAYNGLLFIFLVAAHLSLNWGWVKSNFLKSLPAGRQGGKE